ncbi:MAG: hypothetical protein EOP88_09120 [Verrucomicrobiaceae bacterium]|nr:MAG: hypothetical protein EOP88_09120 [Verrucomicrobiaceae bacterium]
MQNYIKTIGALAAASALVAGNANAEVEYEIHTGYSSQYIFRGLDLGDDLVEVGVDAAAEWNGLAISGGVWATAFDAEAPTGNQIDSEVDLYTEVSKDLGFLTASVGYIYYWNVGNLGFDNQEVYFSVSRDFGFAEAYLTYFWGVDGDNDGYSELGLSRGFELNQCLTLNVGTNVGYLVEQGQATAWTSKVSLDWGFAERATVSPFVAFSVALSDDVDTAYLGSENEFVAGSMLKVGF